MPVRDGGSHRALARAGLIALTLLASGANAEQRKHDQHDAQAAAAQRQPSAPVAILNQPEQAPRPQQWPEGDKDDQPSKFLQELGIFGAVVQAIASVVGLFLVGFTIFYAHKAWKQAQRSADAAHLTLEHAKASSQQELRAYLFAQIQGFTAGAPPDKPMEATVRITNSGKTPAYRVRFIADMKMGAYPDPGDDLKLEKPEDKGSVADIAAGGAIESTLDRTRLTSDESNDIRAERRTLYIFGKATYVDAFKKRQTTTFRYYVRYQNGKYRLRAHHQGNRAT